MIYLFCLIFQVGGKGTVFLPNVQNFSHQLVINRQKRVQILHVQKKTPTFAGSNERPTDYDENNSCFVACVDAMWFNGRGDG